MKISRDSRKMARRLFRLATEGGTLVPARATEIADRLVMDRPRGAHGTLREFTRLIRLELSRRHATIESATPLPAASATSLSQSLQQKYGADLTTEFRVNPDLLGGLRVQVGSNVLDGSVRARLAAFQSQF